MMLPREKLNKLGPKMLSTEELLAIILGSGSKQNNVFSLAAKSVQKIYQYRNKPVRLRQELASIKGLGQAQVSKILAILELHKRLIQPTTPLINPEHIYNWFYFLSKVPQEQLYAIYLDASLGYIQHQLIFKGLIDNLYLSEREIFMLAYKYQAPYLILIHNHPSGTYLPSKTDIHVTQILFEKAQYIGLEIIDHIIISKLGYFSFKDHKLLTKGTHK